MYVHGKPVYATILVDGVEVKVHKDCKEFAKDWNASDVPTAKEDVITALHLGVPHTADTP
jgi:hypothetical protein